MTKSHIQHSAHRVLFLVFIVLSTVGTVNAESQYLPHIPNLTINDFEQDKTGYMWIATDNGACRYNGSSYYHYQNLKSDPSSVVGNVVYSITRMDNDKLWFCTSGGVSIYDEYSDSFINCYNSKNLKCMIEVGEYVVCSGSGGMVVIDKRNSVPIHVKTSEEYHSLAIVADSREGIWGLNKNGRIYKYDRNLNISECVEVGSAVPVVGLCGCCDTDDRIWFGTEQGIIIVDSKSASLCNDWNLLKKISKLDKFAILTLAVCDNHIVIGTQGDNLHNYNMSSGELSMNNLSSSKARAMSLNYTSDFSAVYLDNDKNFWIGTLDRGFGVNFTDSKDFTSYSGLAKATGGKYINAISLGKDNVLWIGSKFKGLLAHNNYTRKLYWYVEDSPLLQKLQGKNINALYATDGNVLWMNLNENIISCHTDNIQINDYYVYPEKYVVNTFMEDTDRRIWAATDRGISIRNENSFKTVAFEGLSVSDLIPIDKDTLLAAVSGHGIYTVSTKDFEVKPYINSTYSDELYNLIQTAVCMMIDSQGTLWVGTQGGLVSYTNPEKFRIYTTKDGLYSNEISSIVEYIPGKIWMGTSYGLSFWDCETDKIVTYLSEDNMQTQQFFPRCSAKSSDRLYFGGRMGLVQFSHETIINKVSDRPVKLVINNIAINGQQKRPSDKLVLKHNEKNVNINYEAIAFLSCEKINFAYRLVSKRFHDDWNYVKGQKNANYSHLSPGKYRFELIAQNPDGIWNTEPKTFDFRIKPSPFLTWYAILIYIIAFGGCIWFGNSFLISRRLRRIKLRATYRELAMEKEFSKMKVDFFNNISHEMRTHLTMIYGPASTLSDSTNQYNRQYIFSLMNYNIQQLLKLLDQTLGLSRIEYGALPLSVSLHDFPECIDRLVNGFKIAAETKGIELKLNIDESCRREIAIDYDIFFKILSNLLSNAIKYTSAEGYVEIAARLVNELPEKLASAEKANSYLIVSVMDNGEGMTEEEIAVIFDRFKRLPKNQHTSTGSGIGLHFANQLIKVHKGSICAEAAQGGGMTFSCALPIDESIHNEESFTSSAISGSLEMAWMGNNINRPEVNFEERESNGDETRPKILIAEDNVDLRMYYYSIFADKFITLLAENGQEAMDMVNIEMPDIVIADVMMPVLNGYELCERIKGDIVLSHIPVVMLTAMMSDNDKITGYQKGADVYITKPFNPNLLVSVIDNLIKKQSRMKERLLSMTNAEKGGASQEDILSPIDRKFVEDLYMYIDEEISNSSINIDDISVKMYMSRASFYRKVKSLTGVTPNNFILIYRLNKAAEMIRSRQYRLNEVADILGFSSPSHFSRSFKNHFGISPKDFE